MINIVGVRFRNAGKVYYFDPREFELRTGSHVIVETARGPEFGTVTGRIRSVEDDMVMQPLREVVRIATPEDEQHVAENRAREREAVRICREKIKKHGLDMKLVDAEYTFDGSKILFYFTADGRIDFRDLVKDLASVFRMRIELRQIGVRDETKMLGGIGTCGRELCCSTYLSDFAPVSIKMAKEQNLSLNPAKISGTCGRLMCCLKNEEDTYEFLNAKMPKLGEEATAPDGRVGKVIELAVLKQKVKVLFEDEDGKEVSEYDVADLTFRPRRRKGEKPEGKDGREGKEARDGQSSREGKEARDGQSSREGKEARDGQDSREGRETRENRRGSRGDARDNRRADRQESDGRRGNSAAPAAAQAAAPVEGTVVEEISAAAQTPAGGQAQGQTQEEAQSAGLTKIPVQEGVPITVGVATTAVLMQNKGVTSLVSGKMVAHMEQGDVTADLTVTKKPGTDIVLSKDAEAHGAQVLHDLSNVQGVTVQNVRTSGAAQSGETAQGEQDAETVQRVQNVVNAEAAQTAETVRGVMDVLDAVPMQNAQAVRDMQEAQAAQSAETAQSTQPERGMQEAQAAQSAQAERVQGGQPAQSGPRDEQRQRPRRNDRRPRPDQNNPAARTDRRNTRDPERPRNRVNGQDGQGAQGSREGREFRDSQGSRTGRDSQGSRTGRDSQGGREARDGQSSREVREGQGRPYSQNGDRSRSKGNSAGQTGAGQDRSREGFSSRENRREGQENRSRRRPRNLEEAREDMRGERLNGNSGWNRQSRRGERSGEYRNSEARGNAEFRGSEKRSPERRSSANRPSDGPVAGEKSVVTNEKPKKSLQMQIYQKHGE